MKKLVRFIVLLGVAAISAVFVYAQSPTNTQSGTITLYSTGWSADEVRVMTTAPFVANGCSATDGYVTSPSDPGNHAHQAALLAAFIAGKNVYLTVSGCFQNRPQIIGVTVTN